MRFFLEVELSGEEETWKLYNGDCVRVTGIRNPSDPSIGRLVRAAAALEEALAPEEDGADSPAEGARTAWLELRASAR